MRPLSPLESVPEQPITNVDVRGNRRVPDHIVRRAISLRPGQRATTEQVTRDVRAIFALEVFEQVSAHYETGPSGLSVVYQLSERPRVSGVRLRGDRVLAAELGLSVGAPYEPARLHERAQDLGQALIDDGFRRASVRVSGVRHAADEVELCVEVRTGPRITIERFEFSGARVVAIHELRELMHADDHRINTPGGVYREDVLARDLLYFAALHYDRGLLSARVEQRVEQIGNRLHITIDVDEGPVYRIGMLSVSGARLATPAKYLELIGARRGDVFSRTQIVGGLERIRDLHRERGEPELDVTPRTTLHPERGVVDLELVLERR